MRVLPRLLGAAFLESMFALACKPQNPKVRLKVSLAVTGLGFRTPFVGKVGSSRWGLGLRVQILRVSAQKQVRRHGNRFILDVHRRLRKQCALLKAIPEYPKL